MMRCSRFGKEEFLEMLRLSFKLNEMIGVVFLIFLIGQESSLAQRMPGARPELLLQTGHSGEVMSVAFSPDGHLLASGGWEGAVILWDVPTGQKLHELVSSDFGPVSALAFSPDGRFLASGSITKKVTFWEVATGHEVRTFTVKGREIGTLLFSLDGGQLLSASTDAATIAEVPTGRELRTFSTDVIGYSSSLRASTLSSNGRWLADGRSTNERKGLTELWDIATGQRLRTLLGNDKSVERLAFSPDGRLLASISEDQTVGIWEAATGRKMTTLSSPGSSNVIQALAFSPNGRWLASTGEHNMVNIWDVTTGRPISALSGHTNGVNDVVFSPQGNLLASASSDRTIRIWEAASGSLVKTLDSRIAGVSATAFCPDGAFLASGYEDGSIRVWDLSVGRQAQLLKAHRGYVEVLAFSPDGRLLASGGQDHTVRLWELATGRETYTLKGHSGQVSTLTFSADGHLLASSSRQNGKGEVILWEVDTGQVRHTFADELEHGTLAFSPNGALLASGSERDVAVVWNVETGNKQILTGLSRKARTVGIFGEFDTVVAFSPDGNVLASGGPGGLWLWDVSTGQQVRTLSDEPGTALRFSPNGRLLASGSKNGMAYIWEVASGREIHMLTGHTQRVNNVIFTPTGKY